MPEFHDDMEAGKLLEWYVKAGQYVQTGQTMCDIETEHAVVEYESPRDAYVVAIVALPSATKLLKVGSVMCIMTKKEEDVAPALHAFRHKLTEEEKFKLDHPTQQAK
jgi:pyruvate dehydrogenase E2 component (dihydrolipoamide acetyltransferase)